MYCPKCGAELKQTGEHPMRFDMRTGEPIGKQRLYWCEEFVPGVKSDRKLTPEAWRLVGLDDLADNTNWAKRHHWHIKSTPSMPECPEPKSCKLI